MFRRNPSGHKTVAKLDEKTYGKNLMKLSLEALCPQGEYIRL
jgi:hypothetical protein